MNELPKVTITNDDDEYFKEQILENTDLRSTAIAQLLALIEQDSDSINRHREAGESGSNTLNYGRQI